MHQLMTRGATMPGDDIVGFAVGIFDESCRNPQIQRMIIWGQLQGEGARMREEAEKHEEWSLHLESIRRAQDEGRLATRWAPTELLTLVFGIVYSWAVAPGTASNEMVDADEIARRREAVRAAVTRLCAP